MFSLIIYFHVFGGLDGYRFFGYIYIYIHVFIFGTPPQFHLFAEKIKDVSMVHYQALWESVQSLSASVTTTALSHNQSWPLVTIPAYEVFGRNARLASAAEIMAFSVRVEPNEIAAFNAYAATQGPAWMAASHQYQQELQDEHMMILQDDGDDDDDDGDREENQDATKDDHDHEHRRTQHEDDRDQDQEDVEHKLDILPFIYDVQFDVTTGQQTVLPIFDGSAGKTVEPLWQTSPVLQNGLLLMSNMLSLQEPNSDGTVIPSPYTVVRQTQGTKEENIRLSPPAPAW